MENRKSNIEALIGMLDESDMQIYDSLRQALLDMGEEVLPYLEKARSAKKEPLWENRIEALIRETQMRELCKELKTWQENPDQDLMRGYFLISKAFYPYLDWEEVMEKVNKMASDLWMELKPDMTALERMHVLNLFFFNRCKFFLATKNTEGYVFSDFFLPNLLNLHQGNDRSLSLLYQYLAFRNQIPVYLLNLPIVNLLVYTKDMDHRENDDIIFFIDLIQHGNLIRKSEVPPFFDEGEQVHVCSNAEILKNYMDLLSVMVEGNERAPFKFSIIKELRTALGSEGNPWDRVGVNLDKIVGEDEDEDTDEDQDPDEDGDYDH
ncbi:MAG: transglutaminase family protein [Bacteroidales bacterium]